MQISPGYETQPQQRTASPGHPENSVDGEGALWQPEYHEPLPQRVPKPSTASCGPEFPCHCAVTI